MPSHFENGIDPLIGADISENGHDHGWATHDDQSTEKRGNAPVCTEQIVCTCGASGQGNDRTKEQQIAYGSGLIPYFAQFQGKAAFKQDHAYGNTHKREQQISGEDRITVKQFRAIRRKQAGNGSYRQSDYDQRQNCRLFDPATRAIVQKPPESRIPANSSIPSMPKKYEVY